MSKGLAWVAGIALSLCIIALLMFGQSTRQAYMARRAMVYHTIQMQQQQQPERIVIWRTIR